ncbi:hypothetical protein PIB30_032065 [Stylosanthes scabra]|uniref:Uncharacterized protein n=1 Tax=Stylosanthes scabra TaxID=79078 RepID=A0ABU6RCX8_9FABA|nr:hypothetical protein [Stylosanthes scabra]
MKGYAKSDLTIVFELSSKTKNGGKGKRSGREKKMLEVACDGGGEGGCRGEVEGRRWGELEDVDGWRLERHYGGVWRTAIMAIKGGDDGGGLTTATFSGFYFE